MRHRVSVVAASALSSPSHHAVSSPAGPRWFLIRAFLCAFLALGLFTPPSRGGYIITVSPNGPNVVANGSGSLNLTALTLNHHTDFPAPFTVPSAGQLVIGRVVFADPIAEYNGLNGAAMLFGSGGQTNVTSGSGLPVGTAGFNNGSNTLDVSNSYVSGAQLTSSSTWANTTISGLGLTPGTYTFTWGSGSNADFLEVIIGVPEPSSLVLAGKALGVVGFCFAIRRWRAAAAAA